MAKITNWAQESKAELDRVFEDSISKGSSLGDNWEKLLDLAESVIYRHSTGRLAGPGDSRTINELREVVGAINFAEGRRPKYPSITRPATTE